MFLHYCRVKNKQQRNNAEEFFDFLIHLKHPSVLMVPKLFSHAIICNNNNINIRFSVLFWNFLQLQLNHHANNLFHDVKC